MSSTNYPLLHGCIDNNETKVSVIIPCYNEPEDIFRVSIQSVINQTLKGVEIIIILDNPDNRELEALVLEFSLKYDNIFVFNTGVNLGRGNARNLGIHGAHGKYIAIHDADDIDELDRLEDQYTLAEATNASLVFSNRDSVDSKGEVTEQQTQKISPDHPSFFRRSYNHQTMFISRETMLQYNGYKDLNFGEDTELWMRIFLGGETIAVHPDIHSHYLAPEESSYTDYAQKMRNWHIGGIKIAAMHFKSFSHDPYFYRFIVSSMLLFVASNFGNTGYHAYLKTLRKTMNFLREKEIIKR